MRPSAPSAPGLATSSPVLALCRVHLSFAGRDAPVEVLRGVDLEVAAGESLAVVGPSGSGKSSLLMLAAGLERPTAGGVRTLGEDLGRLDEDALAALRRGRIGIVFQSFHLIPTMTALDNVAIPLDLAGHPRALQVARNALGEVGLGGRLRHYPAELSGGEQQRVAIARATATEPALLLADEPTGNLDRDTGAAIADLLFGIAGRRDAALVLVTHDRGLAERADRVLQLAGGRFEERRQ